MFLKGNKDLGFTWDYSTMNGNIAFLCILRRVKCCSFLPRCQLLMIQDTDWVSQFDFRECGTQKYRWSSNVMSITDERHYERSSARAFKSPGNEQAEPRSKELTHRDGDSTTPLKVVTSDQAPTRLSGQACPVATSAMAAFWQEQRTLPCWEGRHLSWALC